MNARDLDAFMARSRPGTLYLALYERASFGLNLVAPYCAPTTVLYNHDIRCGATFMEPRARAAQLHNRLFNDNECESAGIAGLEPGGRVMK
jgi:hypothetical protein